MDTWGDREVKTRARWSGGEVGMGFMGFMDMCGITKVSLPVP